MGLLEASFYNDVLAVDARLKQKIIFRTGTYDDLIDLPMNDLDRYGCPALVLASSRAFGVTNEQVFTLAAIVQYIFMADRVHGLVLDGQKEETQYPVLVGDYLYGKFFLELTEHQLDYMLEPLAQVIAAMSEGSIARWIADKNGETLSFAENTEIMGQEKGCFTGKIIGLAAHLCNAPIHLKELLESFGYQMGLGWAAFTQNFSSEVVKGFLEKSHVLLLKIQDEHDGDLTPLYQLYDFFAGELLANTIE